jgi:hypothetical protein
VAEELRSKAARNASAASKYRDPALADELLKKARILEQEADSVMICMPKYGRGDEGKLLAKPSINVAVVHRKFMEDTKSWRYTVKDDKGDFVQRDDNRWVDESCIHPRGRSLWNWLAVAEPDWPNRPESQPVNGG